MRPIKLELNYIGPYQNETIDFNDINQTLFLISGRTGSGKSMIFDAITHALFATASTSARGTESLRSQFAPTTEPSIVSFTFNFRGVNYTVERRLRYFRGTNTTETPPESSIYDEAGELIESGLTKVTSFITDLLQLDAIQFRQIGLLPQGEFRKFLVASSSDKEQILKTLFRTERFNALYQKLKTEYDEDKKQLDYKYQFILNEFKNEITEDLMSSSFKENTQLLLNKIEKKNTLLEEKKEQRENYKKELDRCLKEIQHAESNNKQVESYQNEQNELQEILKQEPVIKEKEKQLEIFLKVAKIKDSYMESKKYNHLVEESEKALSDISTKLETKKETHKNALKELDTLLKSEAQIETYKNQIKKLTKFDTEEYEKIQTEINKKEEVIHTLKKELKNADDELAGIESTLSGIKVTPDAQVTLREKLFDEKNKNETLKREFDTAEKYVKTKEDKKELNNKIMSLSKEREEIKAQIEKQNTDVQSLQGLDVKTINEMIEHLKVGAPCVVCQQTVSKIPDAIQFDAKLYTAFDQLNSEIKALETKLSVLNDYGLEKTREPSVIEKEIKETNKKVTEIENELDTIEVALKKKQELDETRATKKESIQKLNTQLEILTHEYHTLITRFQNFKEATSFDDFNTFKKVYKEMEDAINTFDTKQKVLEADINEEKLALTKLESRLDSVQYKKDTEKRILETHQSKVDTFIESHGEIDPADLESLFSVDGESLKEEIEQYYQAVRDKESVIKSIRTEISSFEMIDLREKYSVQKDISETIDTLSRVIGQLEHEIKILSLKQVKLREKIKEYTHKEESFTKLARFVELLNGKHGNPTLSRFVLVYYLEMILSQANIRLRKMTNGRYELRRVESYRSDQSLHIDVFDYFNNARRSVATLSGGESFQAALALALALSEIIQGEAGSIEMDMLLIDEGFGTLDEETLKIAIDTLFDLQKTGKMIGIISHVEELKTMIGNVLYVETEDERSKTKLVTPLSN